MPSFNAIDMGPYFYIQVEGEPQELQVNAYPGVDGLEVIRMGSRGGTTHAQGMLWADTEADLASVVQTWRAMAVSAVEGTLTDSLGQAWDRVILRTCKPVGPWGPVAGGFGWDVDMEFLHTE